MYAEGCDEFFDYYKDDIMRVTGKGEIKIGVDGPKKQFNEYSKSNSDEVRQCDMDIIYKYIPIWTSRNDE